MVTIPTFFLPSDAVLEQSVVSRVQHGEMGKGGAPRGTTVQHGFHDLGFERPYFEPKRRGGQVSQWQAMPSET